MIANTDTKFYWDLSPTILRFNPLSIVKADVKRIHGIDEFITIENYLKVIEFYHELILNIDSS